jgi:hypothetical protein
MLVLQSCTDSLYILPCSSSEIFATSSDGTSDGSSIKLEKDIDTKEKTVVNVKTEMVIGNEEEECVDIKEENGIYREEENEEEEGIDVKEKVS